MSMIRRMFASGLPNGLGSAARPRAAATIVRAREARADALLAIVAPSSRQRKPIPRAASSAATPSWAAATQRALSLGTDHLHPGPDQTYSVPACPAESRIG